MAIELKLLMAEKEIRVVPVWLKLLTGEREWLKLMEVEKKKWNSVLIQVTVM